MVVTPGGEVRDGILFNLSAIVADLQQATAAFALFRKPAASEADGIVLLMEPI